MSTQTTSSSRAVGRIFGHVLRDPMRSQTYRNFLYLVMMAPLGGFYFTLLAIGFTVSLTTVLFVVGIPILVLTFALVVGLARFERILVRGLLGVDIPTAVVGTEHDGWERLRHLVLGRRTWKALVYLLSEFIYSTAVGWLIGSLLATTVSFLFAPIYYTHAPVVAYGFIPPSEFTLDVVFGWNDLFVGLTTTFQLGSWQIETLPGALLVGSVGLVLLLVLFPVVNAFARLWGRYAQLMLTVQR